MCIYLLSCDIESQDNKSEASLEELNLCQIKRRNTLHKYFKGLDTINLEPTRVILSSADDQFIKTELELVELNMGNASYTVESMSKDIGMSHTQVYRKIKALTGQTINEFIRSSGLNEPHNYLSKINSQYLR